MSVNRVFDWEEEWEWNGGHGKEDMDRKLDKILDKKNNIKINNDFAEIIDFNYDVSDYLLNKIREGTE